MLYKCGHAILGIGAAAAFEIAAHRIVGEALSVKSFTGLELKFAMNAKLAATTTTHKKLH